MSDDAASNSDGTEDTGRDTERRLRRKIERLETALQTAHDHLINLQPHIAQLAKRDQPFIDTHVDLALEALNKEQT